MATEVAVWVPATTANLGSGFDCLGAALDFGNRFHFALREGGEPVQVVGAQIGGENLAYRGFALMYERLGQPVPPVTLTLELNVPLARGLGSSATAIVAGLRAAHYLLGNPMPESQVLAWAVGLEGHPDNVVPAWWGGCRLTCGERVCLIPWHPEIIPVFAIPEFELSTAQARAVLPSQIPYPDAVANLGALGCLLQGLREGSPELLRTGLRDHLHQPYRRGLIPGYDPVEAAALAAGAYGVVISGAGPTLLALSTPAQADGVAKAMVQAWQGVGIGALSRVSRVSDQGAQVA
ncbi:homoserine kinase [Gloeomargarita lithophora Alchichica-D10]|uniref:Homoserine kinase n=1 Tax=Gloeomargarita lithophora Alchichica-D10 TaxID=1188229 RepID=A0A1J0AGD2_9CYAN|nr:homoserine kinase [Gloeomargarita lithophora]APB34998.1 homoserine kinase [Gloeomargarita lithophora Alchichica-D10]